MSHRTTICALSLGALLIAAITLSALSLTRASGSHQEQYLGDNISAFIDGRWIINEHGETRFTLTALRPTDLRCLDQHEQDVERKCEFERVLVLDTPASWTFQPIRTSERWSSHPKFENGELWAIMSHLLAPDGAPVQCTSEEGRVTGYSRTVSDDGSIWCKAQFRSSVEDPKLTIRVGNARYEVTAQ